MKIVLEGIWSADVPIAERRRLMACAATAPLHTVRQEVPEKVDMSIERLEEALVAVGELVGREKLTITAAKSELRHRAENGGG